VASVQTPAAVEASPVAVVVAVHTRRVGAHQSRVEGAASRFVVVEVGTWVVGPESRKGVGRIVGVEEGNVVVGVVVEE